VDLLGLPSVLREVDDDDCACSDDAANDDDDDETSSVTPLVLTKSLSLFTVTCGSTKSSVNGNIIDSGLEKSSGSRDASDFPSSCGVWEGDKEGFVVLISPTWNERNE
jgi:hypothetical protein